MLDLLLRKHHVDPALQFGHGKEDARLARALHVYSESRYDDLIAISDLAMDN